MQQKHEIHSIYLFAYSKQRHVFNVRMTIGPVLDLNEVQRGGTGNSQRSPGPSRTTRITPPGPVGGPELPGSPGPPDAPRDTGTH